MPQTSAVKTGLLAPGLHRKPQEFVYQVDRRQSAMKKKTGFTIIELLVVVAIIGVIAAIAIPGLRSAREHADQASAAQSMRTLTTAEYLFYPKANVYGDLNALGADTTIDSVLAAGTKANYRFHIQTSDG